MMDLVWRIRTDQRADEGIAVKSEIVFDLTEVLLASTSKLRYYGIARVVAEAGAELRKIDPSIRYCVHSPAYDTFLEVVPKFDAEGAVDFCVPAGIRQFRLRKRFYRPNRLRELLARPIRAIVYAINRKAWRKAGITLPELDMEGKIYVSCARPKLIVDAIDTLRQKGKNCAIVPLLHDMIPLHDFFQHRQRDFPTNFIGDNQTVVAHSALIFANSDFTRDEILTFSTQGQLPPVPRVVTIRLVHECPEGAEPAEQLPPAAPYILAVGAATGRKNLEAMFDAMLLLHGTGREVPTLCLAGAFRKRTKQYLDDPRFDRIRERIVIRHNPNQTDLVALYRNAMALVIPSRMEGWGLPAGEALWLGTPAICSTANVFQEVCGELGLYFDPDRPDELAAIIERLMTDVSFAQELRQRITAAKPRLRTWGSVAQEIHNELHGLQKALWRRASPPGEQENKTTA